MERWYLSESEDGTLCIAHESPDYDRPALISLHYPTRHRARDIARHFDDSRPLTDYTVTSLFPGTFKVESPAKFGPMSVEITLAEGGRTLPLFQSAREYPRPKARKIVRYDSGRWWVERGGRVVAV